MEENRTGEPGDRFVASIERFIGILVDRLAQSPSGKLMDEQETRMLGSVLMRAYALWQKQLASQNRTREGRERLRKPRENVPEKRGEEEPVG